MRLASIGRRLYVRDYRTLLRAKIASMPRKGGWTRAGSRRHFRYLDSRGKPITDRTTIERLEALRIPPAWKDVWISPRPSAKLQATGVDAAGRRQYLYHADFRAAQEEAKFDKLIRFAEALPDLREAMASHMELEPMAPEWTCAVAVRLINLAWFRVGGERYVKEHKTFGITTLRRGHVNVRGSKIAFRFRGKHRIWVRTAVVDSELAEASKVLLKAPGGRHLFRYRLDDELHNLTARRLNAYIGEYMGEEFTAKDFRTWGGTLVAAIALAERGPAETATEAKRAVAAVMRTVGERLGNTAAVARSSYVSPAVVEQYLDGRTIDDFRPRHLRVVGARDVGLDLEEQALVSLLRSWRIRRARKAA
jgi:DNA topoisomerase I